MGDFRQVDIGVFEIVQRKLLARGIHEFLERQSVLAQLTLERLIRLPQRVCVNHWVYVYIQSVPGKKDEPS